MSLQMCLVSLFILCYIDLFSLPKNTQHDPFMQVLHINISDFNEYSHLAVLGKISILPGIPVRCKDKLPEIFKRGYRYQTRIWLTSTLCCQNSEPTGLKGTMNQLLYSTLFIHIPIKLIRRNSVLSVLSVRWQYFLSFP